MAKRTLAILIPDHLPTLFKKGELTARYYNPGDFFEKILLISTHDQVAPDLDVALIRQFIGNAEYEVVQLPTPPFKTTLGWQTSLLKGWTNSFLEIIQKADVAMIRCHGAHLNAYLAQQAKRALGIPYVVSLHTVPEGNFMEPLSMKERVIRHRLARIRDTALHQADLVLPVYLPIVPFLESIRIQRYEVAYNVVSPERIHRKTDYSCQKPARLLYVGRLIPGKNPAAIIEAIKALPETELTIVGSGSMHAAMEHLIESNQLGHRIRIIKSMANGDICRMMPNYDLFVVNSEYLEISKTVLEALLSGMPIIINRRKGIQVPELQTGIVRLVDNDPRCYQEAIEDLLKSKDKRQELGERAFHFAQENWHPEITEKKYVAVYQKISGMNPDSRQERTAAP